MFVTMKRGLLIFLALSAFATAMAPRDRRAVNTEEEEELLRSRTTTTGTLTTDKEGKKMVCAPQTPCAWSIYRPGQAKLVEMNITNTYCVCDPTTVCVNTEDDSSVSAYVYRCRKPVKEEEEKEGSTS